VTRPAAWYRDPDGTGALRYWNGSAVYKSDDEAWLLLGNTLADLKPGESIDTAVVFDVPIGTDVESIELHDKPSSRGVTVGL
jgi:Protein of unknown function (DUF2510)